jgi:hypothetical protein
VDAVEPQLAIRCLYLSRSAEPGRSQTQCLCLHPVREGQECVGPFLEDLSTPCGLWERNPQASLIPAMQPDRWRRRRPDGYDVQRQWRGGSRS